MVPSEARITVLSSPPAPVHVKVDVEAPDMIDLRTAAVLAGSVMILQAPVPKIPQYETELPAVLFLVMTAESDAVILHTLTRPELLVIAELDAFATPQ